eukprot:Trichotokara_eunicae@DN3600_c0_g1_i1.p1
MDCRYHSRQCKIQAQEALEATRASHLRVKRTERKEERTRRKRDLHKSRYDEQVVLNLKDSGANPFYSPRRASDVNPFYSPGRGENTGRTEGHTGRTEGEAGLSPEPQNFYFTSQNSLRAIQERARSQAKRNNVRIEKGATGVDGCPLCSWLSVLAQVAPDA